MLNIKEQFLLDSNKIHLNHGSFGACIKIAHESQIEWQLRLESNPTGFIVDILPDEIKKARFSLADYIGCHGDSICFFQNPTTSLNAIVRGLNLGPGDKVLTTDHEYGAMDRMWSFLSFKTGCQYVKSTIKLPIESKEEFVEKFISDIDSKTRVIFISQITSATAIVLPVKEIIDYCRSNNIITIIDGAHVPGHIDIDISELKPDFFTGACHKWMCTPKGVSFLYVDEKYHNTIEPFIVSWGYGNEDISVSKFIDYMEVKGTHDPSAFLTVPTVINFFNNNDWDSVKQRSRSLLKESIKRIHDVTGAIQLFPYESMWDCQMACSEIKIDSPELFQSKLYKKYNIIVPITSIGDKYFIRVSINAYNSEGDIDKLIDALANEIQ